LEEQIQRYCLNLIKINILKILFLFVLLFIFYLFYFFYFKSIDYQENIKILKGSNFSKISSIILKDSNVLEIEIYSLYLKFWNNFIDNMNYGEFKFEKKLNLIEATKIISKPSNVYYKLTIVDGWQEYQLNKLLLKIFNNHYYLNYNEVLAETYLYNSTDSLEKIISLMKKTKDIFFSQYINNKLFKKYSINEILTIASLVEKEGLDNEDKKLISSVIFNRLNINMKLQIDASTIFSITKGKYKFFRKLKFKDLKIIDKYNTYHIKGLPPNPICYVGAETIEIVLENYKTEYLFYFFNENLNKHIFSKTFQEHKNNLEEYRNKNEK